MNEDADSITLSEWETVSPSTCGNLAGRFFENTATIRRAVERLHSSQMLRFTELKDGLQISSFSFVGRVRIGNLRVTVLPKLKAASLMRLLRYAFGFRRLELFPESRHAVEQAGFEDLLITQLNAEAREILSRGLRRTYVRLDERLTSPRGRIRLDRLAIDGGTVTATLPCQHFPRVEDTFLNRVLMAGLGLAGIMASLLQLRRESRRLASQMEEQVSRIALDVSALDQACSVDYSPAP
jgi:5-methylcytosine-specific restriction enzyme subunit McrC